ncbi:non-muscle caldesmon isoform X1 [Synchiropus splendidus]|uniref:non-muscle caldesmon isoform X1 n=1 Tax=Synchiropus splendidus TaxID=270530 RepID=UPI00237D87B8|nr:non-muscle caldesmon isoform X1 [Synchiropus splendidus]
MSLLRRNSSKQGLQNLMRLTAQRSIEDAEEIERERRRRARESLCRRENGSTPGESSPGSETPTEEYDGSLKPRRNSPSLEEDEGFSDWTQRRERRRQQRLQELGHRAEEDEDEEDRHGIVPQENGTQSSSSRLMRPEQDKTRMETREHEEQFIRAQRMSAEQGQRQELMTKRSEGSHLQNAEPERRTEMKVSYTSKVFLQQAPKHNASNGNMADEELTSCSNTKSKRSNCSRTAEQGEAEAILETEQRLEKIRRGLQEKESQEMEQLKHRQAEAEQELEELKRRREARRRVREDEERQREEEEQLRQAKEEEERRRMKEEIERRRMDAAERMKSLSVDGEEAFTPFSPKTPTHKITERTESLNRSLKKSNSFKKTQPLVLLAKIDDKMEQYAHAVENSQEAKAAKPSLNDLPSSLEVVSSKKNLFEGGDAWNSSGPTRAGCKETDGLKVGVANLITQWVKGPNDGSKQSFSKPTDVRPGDVMQKKNMWEVIGDSSGKSGQRTKVSAGNKKYKFVVTGHGKYEKIPMDEDEGEDFTNGKSDLSHSDY